MSSSVDFISSCRHCRYYTPEGRRGGQCSQLDALVHGDWKTCHLATPAFSPHWESFDAIEADELPMQVSEEPEVSVGEETNLPLIMASLDAPQQRLVTGRTVPAPAVMK